MSDLMIRNQPEVQLNSQSQASVVYTPRFDIWEDENEFVLAGDMPGVTPENVDVRFENGELTVWGKVPQRKPSGGYWAQEYGVGDYYRSFTVSEAIDGQKIEAEVKDGVLTIHLPKKEEARPRRIAVKAG